MDLLNAGYSSEGSDNTGEDDTKAKPTTESTVSLPPAAVRPNKHYLDPAPNVSRSIETDKSSALAIRDSKRPGPLKRKHGDMVLYNNPKKDVLYQPVQGPHDPTSNKIKGGTMEANVAFDEATFQTQRSTFQRTGQALGPGDSGEVIVRTTLGYHPERLEKIAQVDNERKKNPRPSRKEKPLLVAGSDDEAEYGVWGPPSKEELYETENAQTDIQKYGVDGLNPDQLAERAYLKERDRQRGLAEEKEEDESFVDRLVERKMAHLLPPRLSSDTPFTPSTKFHGEAELDYKGRSWMHPPVGLGNVMAGGQLGVDHHKCYVPKKCVHRFTGHEKGVHRIRLFPKTGHLLLSAGLDGKCMVWSVEQKKLMRTYTGHSAAVRDVQFNHDGSRFLSASFDRYVRLWDTESGKVVNTFTNRKVPYVVKFYPNDDNIFVVGCSDNKIVAYDATTGAITQEYNHHLGPVNSILFVEDHGTKMVTTSDDKKVLVWEWDIGVPIKYISDPSMHSIPSIQLHPDRQFFFGQSLDNTIVVFQANDRFAMQRKKKFSGHIVSGYACEPSTSPDGKYLVSGDGNGAVFFWDWKRHRIMQKFRAHTSGPAICTAWHPLQESTVFSCGWDGVIKMWQ